MKLPPSLGARFSSQRNTKDRQGGGVIIPSASKSDPTFDPIYDAHFVLYEHLNGFIVPLKVLK